MKYIVGVVVLVFASSLFACVTPASLPHQSTRIDKHEMLICRTMCDKNVKEYSPLTGECECYPKK